VALSRAFVDAETRGGTHVAVPRAVSSAVVLDVVDLGALADYEAARLAAGAAVADALGVDAVSAVAVDAWDHRRDLAAVSFDALTLRSASGVAADLVRAVSLGHLQRALAQSGDATVRAENDHRVRRASSIFKVLELAQNEVFSARSLRPSEPLCFEDLRRSGSDLSRRIRPKWTMLNVS